MLKAFRAALAAVALLVAIGGSPSPASQGSCIMPTTGTVSGLTLVNDLNACHQALLSVYSGATAPSSPTIGMFWYDVSVGYIKQYDGTSFQSLWFVDTATHLSTLPLGAGRTDRTIAAASTTDLGSIPQLYKTIIGTTTINSFGSSAIVGSTHVVAFQNNLAVINSSAIIIPGPFDLQAQSNDVIWAMYLGGGNWRVLNVIKSAVSQTASPTSFFGNAGTGFTTRTDLTPATVVQKVTPIAGDKVAIWDSAASNQIKWINLSSLAAVAGVSSIDSLTGAFTTGNGIGSPGSVIGLTAARRTMPTTQVLTASSGTYTTPANVLWIEVKLVGGSSGGGGGNNAALSTAGGTTCLALSGAACSSPIFASAGGAGSGTPTVGVGGIGSGGYSNTRGGSGSGGTPSSTASNGYGGSGGTSCLGGGNGVGGTGVGGAAEANSGSGGGGGGSSNGSISGAGGSGGSAGGCTLGIINSPAATYTYAIGAGGAGAAGASVSSSTGSAGGAGAAGRIEIIEHYGSWLFVFVGFRARRRRPANDNGKIEVAA